MLFRSVIAFDSRIRTLQDFTSDSDKITKAVKGLTAGSNANRMIDAVSAATRMLRTRPTNRRRIILYIGETRDISSETRLREALLDLQYANVMFYPVDMSRLFSTLSAKPDPGRQDNLPPAMHPMPSAVPATPTSVAQMYGIGGGGRAEFIPMDSLYRMRFDPPRARSANWCFIVPGGSEFSNQRLTNTFVLSPYRS